MVVIKHVHLKKKVSCGLFFDIFKWNWIYNFSIAREQTSTLDDVISGSRLLSQSEDIQRSGIKVTFYLERFETNQRGAGNPDRK